MSHPHIPLLRTHRRRAGLLQRDVAFLLGSTYATKVGRHERGQRVPGVQSLVAYEILFGIGLQHMLGDRYAQIEASVRSRARTLLQRVEALDRAAQRPTVKAFLRGVIDGRAVTDASQVA